MTAARRAVRTRHALAGVVVVSMMVSGVPRTAIAADPAGAAARELAHESGGSVDDFELVHESVVDDDIPWAGKLWDRRTGELHPTYLLAEGTIVDARTVSDLRATSRSDRPPLEVKADAALRERITVAARDDSLPVAVWLRADPTEAEDAVRAGHPEVEWVAGRPMTGSLEQVRSLRAELWDARREVYAAAADAFRREVEALGGTLAYASTSAPLVFIDLPAASVMPLAERSEVLSLGLEGRWETQMSSAGRTVRADWTGGSGDQGSGVRVAVVEYHNVRNAGDLAGQVVRSHSTTGSLAYASAAGDHPTWVAGAVASRSGTYPGTAPGADIVSSSTGGYSPSLATDRAIIAAADWAVASSGGDADVINASIGQDTATGAEEARRYFDSIGWEDGRLVVAAAGNFVTFGNWDIVSPATGYNVLTVGGIDDRNSAGWSDDRVWYAPGSNGSNYHDRSGTSWNTHGDFNKPNLSAPAVSVRTANGIYGDGTSVASPLVAGIAAQVIARAPVLAAWPEGVRAVLMAGALRRTPMPNGAVSPDHEGVGTVDARWSNRILDAAGFGGYRVGAMIGGEVPVQQVRVFAGQRIRVALAWSAHTSGSSNTGKADTLASDLDLYVREPGGAVRWGATFDNSYETVDIVAGRTGTLQIEIRPTRFDTSEEPYGLAWTISGPFLDADDSTFRSSIIWAAEAGITSGCATSRYCPNDSVTRAQMAAFLNRAVGFPATATDHFDDDDGVTHELDINRMATAGVATGCGTRRYCPSRSMSRAETASLLVRALDLPPTSTDYFDDDDGQTHEEAINALARAGIVSGCGDRTYCPTESLTRGEMAALMRRAFGP